MPANGSSFNQISPRTNRVIGINYLAVPLPSDEDGDNVTVQILPNQMEITEEEVTP